MAKTIDADVLHILRGIECDGPHAKIVEQLDRKLYERTNKVLEALGGVWTRKVKAHVFTSFAGDEAPAASIISDAVTSGEYRDAKQEYQFFETPAALARKLVFDAGVQPGHTVLEPSAGLGAIAIAARDAGGSVECVELNEAMADRLIELGFAVYCDDFLAKELPGVGELKEAGKRPRHIDERVDRVVMNPPFSRGQDVDHVRHAFKFLKPGGRLVSVMGAGVMFRRDRKYADFCDWVQQHNGTLTTLPEKSFAASGTNVNTAQLVIDKPLSHS